MITKSDGTREQFDEAKLAASLKKVGASPEIIGHITDQIEREMWEGMTTADIYSRAFTLLRKKNHKTAIKYSLRRALFELGPDGFPFERFVARIFEHWGYEAITDQLVMGSCVEHEVDVVAWKGDELVMAEAKFHNVIGLASDVKIALYVKARFDDLSDTVFDYGGKERKLSPQGHWLVTNTKFTETAIKYGECKGLRMLGWNYPNKDNLHQIIEENGRFVLRTNDAAKPIYTYDRDAPGQSRCTEPCAVAWPPLRVSDRARPTGRWTVIARSDGVRQWAFDRRPVYTNAHDTEGRATADGASGVWHLLPSFPAR